MKYVDIHNNPIIQKKEYVIPIFIFSEIRHICMLLMTHLPKTLIIK